MPFNCRRIVSWPVVVGAELRGMGQILVVCNPAAGTRRRQRMQGVLSFLRKRNIEVQVVETSRTDDARRIASDLPENTETVVIAGGDGTINEVINGLVGNAGRRKGDRLPELALVPMGTANVLAAEIGLTDLSPDNLARTIIDGRRRNIYPARVNDDHFIQMCGAGFDAHVVANVSLRLKRRLGKFAYVIASVAQFWRYVPQMYRIAVDGQSYTAASVIVANGHFYAGRFVCAPQARIDEPLLYACLFQRAGRWHLIRYSWGILSGRLKHFRDVLVIPAMRVTIESVMAGEVAEPLQGDGDIVATLPVTITAGTVPLVLRSPR